MRERCLRTRIDFADLGAAAQQRARHRLLFREGDARAPARSSWPTRRRTAAPARGRPRPRCRPSRARARRRQGRLRPAPDGRPRLSGMRGSAGHSRGGSRRCRSSAFSADAGRDNAVPRLRSCAPARLAGGKDDEPARAAAVPASSAAGSATGGRPRPRPGTAIRAMSRDRVVMTAPEDSDYGKRHCRLYLSILTDRGDDHGHRREDPYGTRSRRLSPPGRASARAAPTCRTST